MPDNPRYVKMPDGSYGKFDADASDQFIHDTILQHFPNAFGPQATIQSTAPESLPQELWESVRNGAVGRAAQMMFPQNSTVRNLASSLVEKPLEKLTGMDLSLTPDLSQNTPEMKEAPSLLSSEAAPTWSKALGTPYFGGITDHAWYKNNVNPESKNPASRAAQVLARVGDAALTPSTILQVEGMMLAPESAQSVLGKIFTGVGAANTVSSGSNAVKNLAKGNVGNAAEAATDALVQGGLTALGTHEGGEPSEEYTPAPENAASTRASKAYDAKMKNVSGMTPEGVHEAVAGLPEDTSFQNKVSAIAKKYDVPNSEAAKWIEPNTLAVRVSAAPVEPVPEVKPQESVGVKAESGQLPETGDTVVFNKPVEGYYVKPGQKYTVLKNHKDLQHISFKAENGGGDILPYGKLRTADFNIEKNPVQNAEKIAGKSDLPAPENAAQKIPEAQAQTAETEKSKAIYPENFVPGDPTENRIQYPVSKPGEHAIATIQHILDTNPDVVEDEARIDLISDKLGLSKEDAKGLFTRVSPWLQKTPETAKEHIKKAAEKGTEEEHKPEAVLPLENIPTPRPQTPSAETLALEDRIRPLVGKSIRLQQLVTGNKALQAIQEARDATYGGTPIEPETAKALSQLLKEPVGDKLTDAQIKTLNGMLGRTLSEKPKILHAFLGKVRRNTSPEMQANLVTSRAAMLDAFNKTTDAAEKKALGNALELDKNGNPKPFLYRRMLEYPKPFELGENSPEYPFTKMGFPAKITPISLDNLEAALGKRPRDLTLGRATPEELAQLRVAENPVAAKPTTGARTAAEGLQDLFNEWDVARGGTGVKTPDEFKKAISALSDESKKSFSQYVSGAPARAMSVQEMAEEGLQQKVAGAEGYQANPELRKLKNTIYENSVKRELNSTKADIRELAQAWKEGIRGFPSDLRNQLALLPTSIKRMLPGELFEEQKSSSASPFQTTANPKEQESVSATKTPSPSASTPSPQAQKTLGKVETLSAKIAKDYPEHSAGIATIMDAAEQEHPDPNNQIRFTHLALREYAKGLENKDEFALKRALDVIKRTHELGALGNLAPYTPEELRAIAVDRSNAILHRYEGMTPLQLASVKEALWDEGLRRTIEDSEDPVIQARYKNLIRQVPPSRSPSISILNIFRDKAERDEARMSIRKAAGSAHYDVQKLRHSTQAFDQLMDTLSQGEQLRFIDLMEQGEGQLKNIFQTAAPGKLEKWMRHNDMTDIPDPDEIAEGLRTLLDSARDDVAKETKLFKNYIEDYMPHIFVNVPKAMNFAKAWVLRNPLEGNKGFLKSREYQFLQDAMAEGLQPVTTNPVRLALMRVEQLRRFQMAHEIKNDFVARGLAARYSLGQQPDGWVRLNDNMFEPKSFSEEGGGFVGRGFYYAPPDVASTFNNFVSVGMSGKPYVAAKLYDAVRAYSNMANQFQLSTSFFHGTETLFNAALSDAALGFKQIFNEGKIGHGVLRLGRSATLLAPIIRDAYFGNHMMLELKEPGAALKFAQAAKDLETANGHLSQDPFLRTHQTEALKRNWKIATNELLPGVERGKAALKSVFNTAGVLVEHTAWPLMDWLIPRVKAGTYYDTSRQIRSQMAGASEDEINIALCNAWDSMDNRYGQVTYNNLFMNRTAKDMLTVILRSPGWNIGTLREVAGGFGDLAKGVYQKSRGGKFVLSDRAAYVMALMVGTAYINALYQHLHKDAPPVEGLDYLYPRNGTKNANGDWNRFWPKLYTYDFVSMYKHPYSTIEHKEAPALATMSELKNNADYFGEQIVDPGDPISKQAGRIAQYMVKQTFEPFSISNYQERKIRGETDNKEALLESMSGILPAPKWVGQSKASQLAYGYFITHQSQGPEDPADFERKKAFIQLRDKFKNNTLSEDDIDKALNSGEVSPGQLTYLFKNSDKNDLQRWTSQLTVNQAWNVWRAANSTEKGQLLSIVIPKIAKTPGPEQEQRLNAIYNYESSR